jgi:PAS domain S-box-containing protein
MPLAELSLAGVVVLVNASFCELLGRSSAELVGCSLLDFTHPDDRDAMRAILDAAGEETPRQSRLEKRCIRGDGVAVWVRVTVMTLPEKRRVIAHVVDIDDLMAARHAAYAAQRRLAALIEHSSDLIVVLDDQGKLVEGNPAAERVLGWRVKDFLDTDMLELIHPDDLPTVLASLADTYANPGLRPAVTFRIGTADGRWVHLESIGNNQLSDPEIEGVIVNARDVSEAVRHRERTEANLDAVVTALALASEFRDPYTAGHQNKVARLSKAIGTRLGLAQEHVRGIALAASLHDIGKIAIPAEILTRPGRLSPIEFELVKTHCQIGHDILAGIEFGYPVAEIVLHHHERLDGSGYPHGLAGEAVSLGARIVGIADVIDAMSSHRPYRPSLGLDAALQELTRNSGTSYDAAVVVAAIEICSGAADPADPSEMSMTR